MQFLRHPSFSSVLPLLNVFETVTDISFFEYITGIPKYRQGNWGRFFGKKKTHKTAARIGGLPFCVYMRGEIVSHSSICKIEYRINVSSLCPVPKNVLKFIKEK